MGKFFKTSKSENRTITTKKGRFMTIFNRIASRQRNSREITPPLIDNQLSPIMETDAEEPRHTPSELPQNTTPNIIIPEILHPQTLPPFENIRSNFVSCPANLSTIPIQTRHPRPTRGIQSNVCTHCEQHCPTTTICKHCPIHCFDLPIENSFFPSTPECVLFNHHYPSTSYRSTPTPLTSFDANLSSDFEQIDLSPSDHLDMALIQALNANSKTFNPLNQNNSDRNSKSPSSSSDRSTSTNIEHLENLQNTNSSRPNSSNPETSSNTDPPIFDTPLASSSNPQPTNPPMTIHQSSSNANASPYIPSTSIPSNPFTQH